MLCEDIEVHSLIRELFSSVRDVDKRLEELQGAVTKGWIAVENKDNVKKRMSDLVKTRFCLMKSICIIKQSVNLVLDYDKDLEGLFKKYEKIL